MYLTTAAFVRRTLTAILVVATIATGCTGTSDDEQVADEELATFTVDGATATMTGVINSSTPDDVRSLLDDHPEVTTIEMIDVPGSIDDAANLEASRLIRDAGLATHANANSALASGGVDFFLAGATRTYDPGAQFGVHSWATGDGTEGINVPRDDQQHNLYLDYYAEMGIDPAFYWFTLEAAPADDIYWMTNNELTNYGFAT